MIRFKKSTRVVVAMSGGVDSSVAAALLKRKGYDVIGISMKLWPKEDCGFHRLTSCCSLESISDARLVSEKLRIPFYVLDLHEDFKREVIDYFTKEYLDGRTPNPCILCNEKIKFGILLKKAKELGAEFIATGHYAKVGFDRRAKRYILEEGKDKRKDQSYALFSLTQDQLSKTLLPLGALTKDSVRKFAKRNGLPVHSKIDSQEICFVQSDYAEYLKKEFKDKIKPGPIVDQKGDLLGMHKGTPFYTIGQRGGLGIAHSHALYVTHIDKEKNTLIVGPKEARYRKRILVSGLNWMIIPEAKRFNADVKIRSQHKKASGELRVLNGSLEILFEKAQESPAPGQAAVFYKRGKLLGGGWISNTVE